MSHLASELRTRATANVSTVVGSMTRRQVSRIRAAINFLLRRRSPQIKSVDLFTGGMDRTIADTTFGVPMELKDTLIEGGTKVQVFAPKHVKFRFRRKS